MVVQAREAAPWTVHVSDALQARLDDYREQDGRRTTTSVVFEAVEELRAELPRVVRTARARRASPVGPQEDHYLGTGPVVIRIRPAEPEAALLEQLSRDLGVPASIWIPAVLNAYLPGRREPENMPWLVQEQPE